MSRRQNRNLHQGKYRAWQNPAHVIVFVDLLETGQGTQRYGRKGIAKENANFTKELQEIGETIRRGKRT